MTREDRLVCLGQILGIDSVSEKYMQMEFELDFVEDQILTYINQESLPEKLERPLLMIAAAHWKSAGYGSAQAAPGPVTSVKRGDVTTSFAAAAGADASSGTFGLGGGDGFFGWRTTLNAYRKLRW